MDREKYEKERKVIKRDVKVLEINYDFRVDEDDLLSSIESAKKKIRLDTKLNSSRGVLHFVYDEDEEYNSTLCVFYVYNDWETEEEVERRLWLNQYYKDQAVKSMKELIDRNSSEAIEYLKEKGLI